MKRPVQITLAFAGVFLMGAVTGGFVTAWMKPEMPYQRASGLFSEQQFEHVANMLNLTSEQRDRTRPIVTKVSDEVQTHRKEVRKAFDRMQEDFRKELSDEQRAKYDDWRKRQRDAERRFQHWAREQRTHHPEFSADSVQPRPPQSKEPATGPAR
ncbi:hypothetical protein DB347_14725 [Opitutaceae bacterium EW11]|nr:hypothetical protein DB347_14725 [Opitutaceae bacterium EW11]